MNDFPTSIYIDFDNESVTLSSTYYIFIVIFLIIIEYSLYFSYDAHISLQILFLSCWFIWVETQNKATWRRTKLWAWDKTSFLFYVDLAGQFKWALPFFFSSLT